MLPQVHLGYKHWQIGLFTGRRKSSKTACSTIADQDPTGSRAASAILQ